jgi:hypothetical protein
MLNWLVEDKQMRPHIPVIEDGTFSRSDFRYDAERDDYHCPVGKELRTSRTVHEGTTLRKLDCDRCSSMAWPSFRTRVSERQNRRQLSKP